MGWRIRTLAFTALGVTLALSLAACGSEDYPNEPRPPIPLELTASIGERGARVEPARIGFGDSGQPINQNEGVAQPAADPDDPLTVFITISNTTGDEVQMVLSGPTESISKPIPPNSFGEMKIALETGKYRIRVPELENSRATFLTVGPERVSSQNALLLP